MSVRTCCDCRKECLGDGGCRDLPGGEKHLCATCNQKKCAICDGPMEGEGLLCDDREVCRPCFKSEPTKRAKENEANGVKVGDLYSVPVFSQDFGLKVVKANAPTPLKPFKVTLHGRWTYLSADEARRLAADILNQLP